MRTQSETSPSFEIYAQVYKTELFIQNIGKIKGMILHTMKEKLGINFHPGYTEPLFPPKARK